MDLDPRMTFTSFVVGPGNRLASAAARRAADSPAASYNPLFLYSASGLGKSHILLAMAHHSERLNPDSNVLYQTLEGYLAELTDAIQSGGQEQLKDRYRDLDILLLDDVQFLTGQPEAQEMLLRTLDSLNLSGSQIVLASDRPPAEIDGLDARLLSRFSGGLMVDIAPPELETRVAIIRKKCQERETELPPGVAEALARLPFRNVRELMGGLNRVLAAQDLEGRTLSPEDIPTLVDVPTEHPMARQPARNVVSVVPDAPVREFPWQRRLREAAEPAEAEGFSAARLRRAMNADMEPSNVDGIIADFEVVLEELRQIRSDLDVVGNPWPEAARGVLMDPERLEEARALLASARERVRDFPPFRDDRAVEQLSDHYPAVAVKAAEQLISDKAPEYNPLFVWSPGGHGARELLEAAGTSCLRTRPGMRVAMISAKAFADEFVGALSDGVAGAWRERWWTVELLLVYDCQELSQTERAQDEFFHLFEAVKRRGARILLAADRPPAGIEGIDDRLRSRFEAGLAVEVPVHGEPPLPEEELLARRAARAEASGARLETDLGGLDEGGEVGPDLEVRQAGAERTQDPDDPEFAAALDGLDGGSEQAAWSLDGTPSHKDGPAALTKLTLQTDDFPTLLSEQRKERERAGLAPEVPDIPAPAEQRDAAPGLDAAVQDPASDDPASMEVPGAASSQPNPEQAPILTAADLPGPPPGRSEQAAPPTPPEPADSAVQEEPDAMGGQMQASAAAESTGAGPTGDDAIPAQGTGDDAEVDLGSDLDEMIDSIFQPYDAPRPSDGAAPPARADGDGGGVAVETERATVVDAEHDVPEQAADTGPAPEAHAAPAPSPAAPSEEPAWWPSAERVVWDGAPLESRIVVDDEP